MNKRDEDLRDALLLGMMNAKRVADTEFVKQWTGQQQLGAVSTASARSSPYTTEYLHKLLRETERRVSKLTEDVDRLSAFYYWVTEVHPQLAAQYKAMRDLYDAANPSPKDHP